MNWSSSLIKTTCSSRNGFRVRNNCCSVMVANGNFFTANSDSGAMTVGTAGTGVFGTIETDALESSTVDLATQLSDMISAQRGYEANTKVMQAASDLLKLLNNIQT